MSFKRDLRKLKKLMRRGKCTSFIGYGMMPICKSEYLIPIMKQLDRCFQYEPFLRKMREDMGL